MSKKITPESLLPDKIDGKVFNNVYVRKGSIATCIFNALILDDPAATEEEKAQALTEIERLAPALEQAFSFSKALIWKNPKVNKLFEAILK